MYSIYKKDPNENLYQLFFKNNDMNIDFNGEIIFAIETFELQFSNYKLIPFSKFKPFVDKYFSFNDIVIDTTEKLKLKYNIQFENTCGVFYRGNDKVKETQKPPYNEVVEQAIFIKNNNPSIKFIVQTDEFEFLQYFLHHFPDAIYFDEIPVIHNQMTTVAYAYQIDPLLEQMPIFQLYSFHKLYPIYRIIWVKHIVFLTMNIFIQFQILNKTISIISIKHNKHFPISRCGYQFF